MHAAPHNTVRHYILIYRIRHCFKLHYQIIQCVRASLRFIVWNSCLYDEVQKSSSE